MRIAIGSDHAGFELKGILVEFLTQTGYQINDLGTYSPDSVDYPDFAEAVALNLLANESDRGILICGSGVGASVAANKIPGIRAGLCHDGYSAHQGVEHDDMNVLVLGSRVIGPELAKDLCLNFLNAQYDHLSRHERRLEKVISIEQRYGAQARAAKEKRS